MAQEAQSIQELVTNLARDVPELLALEARLVLAELREAQSKATSGAEFLAIGAAFLLAGLILLFGAAAALLVHAGLPLDEACLIVAVVAMLLGGLLLAVGLRVLKTADIAPARRVSELLSMIGRS